MYMRTPNQIAEIIVETITGVKHRHPRIIHISGDIKRELNDCDFSFPLELKYWRGYIDPNSSFFHQSSNILEYFMLKVKGESELTRINQSYLLELKDYIVTTTFANGDKNFARFFNLFHVNVVKDAAHIRYYRPITAPKAIKSVYEQGSNYGKIKSFTDSFKLVVDSTKDSEITNMRLELLKKVSSNLLQLHGYNVQDESCTCKYVFTIKSEGKIDNDSHRYLCGPVVNSKKKKEVEKTAENYVQEKIKKVSNLNAEKHSNVNIDKNNVAKDIRKIVNAAISYELVGTKHSSPVMLDDCDKIDNSIKTASFVLYNCVRMNAILEKYAKLVLEYDIPEITDIDKIHTFHFLGIEEWGLIYNYILKYPDVLRAAVTVNPKLEVNILLLWSFVWSLCQDFSKYYRKNRILMNTYNFNFELLQKGSERMHILKALHIILRNALSLLEVEEIKYM